MHTRAYYESVEYEWDPDKATANVAKHGVHFADAALALEDPLARTIRDPGSDAEDRFVTLAMDPFGRLLVVVYTHRDDRIRIISARAADPRERRDYEAST